MGGGEATWTVSNGNSPLSTARYERMPSGTVWAQWAQMRATPDAVSIATNGVVDR